MEFLPVTYRYCAVNMTFGVNPTRTPISPQSVTEILKNKDFFYQPCLLLTAVKAARSRAHPRAALSARIKDSDQQRHFAPSFTADLFLSSSVPAALVSQSPPFTGRRQ